MADHSKRLTTKCGGIVNRIKIPELPCIQCGVKFMPDLVTEDPEFPRNYLKWRNGTLIQKVWPDAKPMQREQLQTGLCSDKCWNKFLGIPNVKH